MSVLEEQNEGETPEILSASLYVRPVKSFFFFTYIYTFVYMYVRKTTKKEKCDGGADLAVDLSL